MKRWKPVLGVLLVFLLGAIAGAAIVHRVDRKNVEGFLSGRGGATADFVVRRLSRSLDLDPVQQDQVRAIVNETRRDIVEIRKPVQDRIHAAFERSRVRIREVLRPDQQEKFDRIRSGGRKRWGRPD